MSWLRRSRDDEPKVRYAVVGLGWIAQAAVLPAFANVKKSSELVALVSDDDEKLARLSRRYGGVRTYRYADYQECLESGEVDAVYICLPNTMHREYAEIAARAGVHVLCEKPMATTVEDCDAMIQAAREAHVKLMVAYRLHFEIANLEAIDIVQSGTLGRPRIFSSVFAQDVAAENTRLRPEMGEDAALFDMGIYQINAARYLFQEEPLEVFAQIGCGPDPRFRDVGEMTTAFMRFPGDKLAQLTCSFGAASESSYEVLGTEGRLRVEPAFTFDEDLAHELVCGGKTTRRRFARRDQFGPEIEYFTRCILEDEEPEPSGSEGLHDVAIIEAMHRSISTKQPQLLSLANRRARPSMAQEIRMKPRKAPPLVHADAPTR